MQPNQIAVVRKAGLGLTLREMTWIGKVFYKSGMFTDTRDEAIAIVKIMAGQEMGLAPFESMTGINIIKNRPTLAAATIGAKIKASIKYDYRVKVATELKSQIDFYEIENGKKSIIGSSTYTIEQAKQAGLLGKDNWRAYPEDMLFARNISRGSRRYTPDVFSTPVYTQEELEEESPGGLNYIPSDGGQKTLPAQAPQEIVEDPPEGEAINELDESIIEENTQEELEEESPIQRPAAIIDEQFKETVLIDLELLELDGMGEKRLIKEATGKIVTTKLSDEEWRLLRHAIERRKESKYFGR